MSTAENNWHSKNTKYLSASVAYIRLRLEKAIAIQKKSQANYEPIGEDDKTRELLEELERLETAEPIPSLAILGRRLGLTRFEQDVLMFCTAFELDTGIATMCANAHDDAAKPFPTLSLAIQLFREPAWSAVSPQGPLRYWRLIELTRLPGQSLISAPFTGDERIVNFIKGLNYLDERISRICSQVEPDNQIKLSASQEVIVNDLVDRVSRSLSDEPNVVVQLIGADQQTRRLIAEVAATRLALRMIHLETDMFPSSTADVDDLGKLWQRESRLLPIAAFIDVSNVESRTEGAHTSKNFVLHRFLELSKGIFFIGSHEMRHDLHESPIIVQVKKPTSKEQLAEWSEVLGKTSNGSAALLSGQFNFNIKTIHEIVDLTEPEDEARHHDLWRACIDRTSSELDALIQKMDVKATWDDIVLPDHSLKLLKQIAGQARHRSTVYDRWGFRGKMNRGLGINALFAGESGTGKTMAAEVLANDLKLNLYRIDLSGVVSKYIGETEKNLRRVFDAAENGGAILFFDEADALFGKRTEVKDSHDRYANIEINYLLQRMESYGGLSILATNKRSALDEAFTRRLRFIIQFPFPGVRERLAIVQKAFPAEVPKEYLDYDRLASFNLTGGSYYNIAVNAAFRAAEEGTAVTMPIVLSAARMEFEKIERPIKESDFHWNE